jgi:eukaryotic translation initiation factor 2C
MEPTFTQYFGRVSYNVQPRNDGIEQLEDMVVELLQAFAMRNNAVLPMRILFYRDGISEGQFRRVLNLEVIAIKKAIERTYPQGSKSPTLSFIVAQKRHHTVSLDN